MIVDIWTISIVSLTFLALLLAITAAARALDDHRITRFATLFWIDWLLCNGTQALTHQAIPFWMSALLNAIYLIGIWPLLLRTPAERLAGVPQTNWVYWPFLWRCALVPLFAYELVVWCWFLAGLAPNPPMNAEGRQIALGWISAAEFMLVMFVAAERLQRPRRDGEPWWQSWWVVSR